MSFITLHDNINPDRLIIVAADSIIMVAQNSQSAATCSVVVTSGGQVTVNETPEEVLALLQQVKGS